ncbi:MULTISPECIES: tRNA (N(6)-L-threonylcarbamoyladenosine(37)-C(2))-methylthiotransferase MtaB [Pseudomonadati]|uniref:tRNA (N(6)-L-threonylcarbamoyladenosine(37)-C(2))- methylthiotransferase MtaB n=1 Tax=unclassified Halobacteriovorax TaxID=2639665 RepID=UPI000CD28798|nr:tRNA (N(6)-L-threonylcarbamoyladenosine(37)-C(2))-methylthiotransferase MtaB [Halobacteriovorax sp. DA5]POB13908.1 tRNA (N(6)-L-threonylcarbamoyladenosine(37)-C(2))-methylthiotransferase MtaB [Halobacteriovorax sp. DA5]
MTTEVDSTNNELENFDGKKVAFHTLGCRLNFSETGTISQGFVERGYKVVEFGEQADVTFINTCTVTDSADSTCRNLIRKAHRSSPDGKIVVAGCYAQMDAPRIAKMTGVDLVLGTSEKYKVFDYLNEDETDTIHIDKSKDFFGAATSKEEGHTRAFLKIQDGCNYVCSFCIIPFARGRSKAVSIAQAMEEARAVVAQGFKEIVLTGVNIGEYETTSGEKLLDLLKELNALEGLERIRLGSVEPNTITDELLDYMHANPKFLDHFHVPMQSGNDEILSGMKRKYTVEDYKTIINKIITRFPNAGIGADVICGFPGETDEQFQDTFNLLKELPITHFHVFPYSKRKNTVAARMEDHIQHPVKKSRVKTLMMLGDAKLNMFSEDYIGETSQVLFEKKDKQGLWEGYTSNFIRVKVAHDGDLKNQIHQVRLIEFKENKVFAELC